MPGFLLDTNHLGETLNPVSVVRDRIYQERRKGNRIGTCVPVLCELEVGIRQLVRQEQSRRELATLMNQVRVWPIDQTIVARYGLASLARVMNLTLLTTDRDFEALPDLRTEDWTI